jgi:hypothetical protein
MAVDVYAGSMNQLTATDLFSTPVNAARRLKAAIVELRRDPLEQFAPSGSTGLRALTRYVNRCTTSADRLLVLGFQPEVFFYADRRIAGEASSFTTISVPLRRSRNSSCSGSGASGYRSRFSPSIRRGKSSRPIRV